MHAYAIHTRQPRNRHDVTLSSCDVQFGICRDLAEAVWHCLLPMFLLANASPPEQPHQRHLPVRELPACLPTLTPSNFPHYPYHQAPQA